MWRAYGLAVLVTVLFFTASDGFVWLRDVARQGQATTAGLGTATVRTKGFFAALREVQELRQQLAVLEAENRELRSTIVRSEEAASQASAIAKQLDTAHAYGDALLPARVVVRTPTKLHEELTLNVGRDDGVESGMAVLVDGYLAGITNEVGKRTTTVTLLTNASVAIPVVLTTSRAQGILRGGLAGITVGDIPADLTVAQGESVLTSALGGVVPADIPVGTVTSAITGDSDILQRIGVNSPIHYGLLEHMIILRQVGHE